MASEPTAGPQLEIAHVLFMDLVEYSRLPMEEQPRRLAELQELVRGLVEFRRAEEAGDLIRLPTGDGMALVFFRDPVAPVQCAVRLARALRDHPHLKLRMGLHSGPVYRVADINANVNVSGGGINLAQRVMDCGHAGHVLLSSALVELLGQVGAWPLHDLGECEVKHGARLHLFNLVSDAFGNPAVPEAIERARTAATPPRQGATKHLDGNRQPHSADPGSPGAPPLLPELEGDPGGSSDLESEGGAVPLDSPFYVTRPVDEELRTAIARGDSIVLVKGARQMGKTSLLARGLQQAREAGARVVFTDFQKLTAADLAAPEALYRTLSDMIADQLDLEVPPDEAWNPRRGPGVNFERYLRREALGEGSGPVVWGLDEVDRLFVCSFGSEVFGLFRSWHNGRALDPAGPWRRLTMAIAYATEAHLFISDMNQSPFNVGTRLSLSDFTAEEVAELNRRYGAPLRDVKEVARFQRLLGGQPYLVRRGLHEMAQRSLSFSGLQAQADRDEGIFGDHLRRILVLLTRDAELYAVVRGLLQGAGCPTGDAFYRLRSAGLLSGDSAREARLRCQLYASYLERQLV